MTTGQVISLYREFTSQLALANPPSLVFSEEARIEDKFVGTHVPKKDGSYVITLTKGLMQSEEKVAITIIHELSHHILWLSGYRAYGHAWPMLAVEQILLRKIGYLEFDSVQCDARTNWPKWTSWKIWLQHVEYAYHLSNSAVENNVLEFNAPDIARWVLDRPPQFEPTLFKKPWGRKAREMWHTFISDLRCFGFLRKWLMLFFVGAGFFAFVIGSEAKMLWLATLGEFTVIGALIVAFLLDMLARIWRRGVSAVQGLRGQK